MKTNPTNHGGEINNEESWKGSIGRGVIEKESLSREASGRHLGGIWKASGRHLEGIWEASGKYLGGIWDSRRPWGSRGLQDTKDDAHRSQNSKVLLKC